MESKIESLINEGWKPRIKTRKNRKYITLRKGDKEKSLGPYTEELWDKVKPVDPWATPAQISELEKRLDKVEENQSDSNPSLDTLFMKRIKQLEENQRLSNKSLSKLLLNFEKEREEPIESVKRKLEKRMRRIEKSQQGANPSFQEKRINKLEEMRKELLESVESKLRDDKVCRHIGKNGFCHHWHYSYDEVEKREYLQLRGRTTYKGEIIYYVNVKEHPLICSACPDYEPKS